MIEFLMVRWVEVVFVLLMVIFLLLIIFVNMCYQEAKIKYEDELRAKELSKKEKTELKKMMPELPKEDK
jgi:hypothetical protein